MLTGEQGYRSAIISHGIAGKDHSSFYFEVEVLPPCTPLPFLNIKPAVRVGICNVDIQDVDKPLGCSKVSYAYSSTGKLVTDSKAQMMNATYQTGDVISVVVNRLPNKPEFLRQSSALKHTESAKSDKFKDPKSGAKKIENQNSVEGASEMIESDLANLEVSDGSFVEFFKNGDKQAQYFSDIYEANYFAALSLYMNAKVAVNFGQSKF